MTIFKKISLIFSLYFLLQIISNFKFYRVLAQHYDDGFYKIYINNKCSIDVNLEFYYPYFYNGVIGPYIDLSRIEERANSYQYNQGSLTIPANSRKLLTPNKNSRASVIIHKDLPFFIRAETIDGKYIWQDNKTYTPRMIRDLRRLYYVHQKPLDNITSKGFAISSRTKVTVTDIEVDDQDNIIGYIYKPNIYSLDFNKSGINQTLFGTILLTDTSELRKFRNYSYFFRGNNYEVLYLICNKYNLQN